MVFRDQRQRQIHARGHAGRGDQATVADVDAVVLHLRQRELGCQLRRVAPVRGGVLAVQQAGAAKQEGAGADRSITRHLGCHLAQPFGYLGLFYCVRQLRAAGDQHNVVIATSLRDDEIHA